MNALERIWAAMPSDGVMKPETMYGWTTSDQIDEWRNESDNTSDNGDLLVYFEYIRADVAADMVATALREAARVALNACLVPPDGGSPTENEAAVCAAASRYILALIPRETAMTELARLGQELE